ncbi:methyltransferase family protein [Thermospira aquatica]|uniref:Isoprenylcysteine carboxylmethyltransferase family protein n=1 Tax=Thermospira aquatica TaxID=2828656 RepID=A0AAX3BBY0_9SPIR|nr:isoprenylcysteine carboxylmethyltransferase family protein [Thermospira aquatica]URA09823.1 isoprenylcysteine carboxylmethyltransferase family protein [Thermospira aquatica]
MKWIIVGLFSVLVMGRWYFKVKSHSIFDSYKGKEPFLLVLYRILLGLLQAIVTVMYLFEWSLLWMTHPVVPLTEWLGIGMSCFAIGLIFWAHAALGENFSPSLGKAYRLVQEGPYRYIRHPIYVGYIGLFLAVDLMTGWWLMALLGELILLSLVLWRLPLEEGYLEETFQDAYHSYARRTKRFLPGIF